MKKALLPLESQQELESKFSTRCYSILSFLIRFNPSELPLRLDRRPQNLRRELGEQGGKQEQSSFIPTVFN